MLQILCYGDSNTFGFDPGSNPPATVSRRDYDERWTGRVAKALNGKALIIESGLNGRTAAFDDPIDHHRNGLKGIGYFLETHMPLDGIVIMLGTNDTKRYFAADARSITAHMQQLLMRIIRDPACSSFGTKIILVAPVPLNENACDCIMDKQSVEVSRQLGDTYRELAQSLGIIFADAGKWNVELSGDGCHFSANGHAVFAEHMTELLKTSFGI